MELKICISPQFRAIDPPNPARGFIQQNENVRFATAACMQKYGNVSFATVACAKCMRYGGRGGGPIPWGGGGGVATRDTEPYIQICKCIYIYMYIHMKLLNETPCNMFKSLFRKYRYVYKCQQHLQQNQTNLHLEVSPARICFSRSAAKVPPFPKEFPLRSTFMRLKGDVLVIV